MKNRKLMNFGRAIFLIVEGTKYEKFIHDVMIMFDTVHDGFDMAAHIAGSVKDIHRENIPGHVN